MVLQNKILIGSLVTLTFLAIGTAGYAMIENFSILDAFYMTVITISTVGFGEIHTLSETGRIFTIFLILFGFGSIGFLAHAFTEILIEKAASGKSGRKNMLKRIRLLKNHVIICGYGRVGAVAAEHFASMGADFVVLETAPEQLKLIEDSNHLFLEGDASREDTLLSAGIKRADALVALLDSDPENLFTVLTARELNPTLHIIARTEIATSESRMLRAGADGIISPYASAGRSVAEKVLASNQEKDEKHHVETATEEEPVWLKVTEQSDLAGHVVQTAESFLEARILGIRRDDQDTLLPHHQEQINLGDMLLIRKKIPSRQPEKYRQRAIPKIVFIDDNPVICRLYTRLFQKAGFHLLTANTGSDGYRLITAEHPDAAVIDFELPDINGLEVCKLVRENEELAGIRIFLFTATDDAETRKEATATGIDTVVIKSPDAGEIVDKVKKQLLKESRKGVL